MKTKALLVIFGMILFASCGPKPGKSTASLTTEINSYVSQVDANKNLKQETIEGALTDTQGFKDIGNYKYTVYFDEQSNTLYKIKNVETTAETLTEVYYFKDGDVVLIDTKSAGTASKMYVHKNKVISETKTEPSAQKLLLEKANRFLKAFQREH
ncbi:hypothetical protein [uncultured Gelidibacter sp.]|uniref:hypothetical protein n=1 Tax=uncultured Gelidibacter sp. TaxID=259318 RepID=UPI00261A31F7|nr:hypothetical protein [uncultured Gelidibacter sp.]